MTNITGGPTNGGSSSQKAHTVSRIPLFASVVQLRIYHTTSSNPDGLSVMFSTESCDGLVTGMLGDASCDYSATSDLLWRMPPIPHLRQSPSTHAHQLQSVVAIAWRCRSLQLGWR